LRDYKEFPHPLPAFIWKLTPPEKWNLPEPQFREGNCRIRIRDKERRTIKEHNWTPSGQLLRGNKSWTEPLSWEIPVELHILPKEAGEYIIEASFRTYYLRDDERGGLVQNIIQGKANISPYYIAEAEQSDEVPELKDIADEQVVALAKDDILKFNRGRWIGSRKEFRLSIDTNGKLKIIEDKK
jgi:hypothetical protein